MDNASKALIMAGAILIAVALVGVGVYLYSSAASQVDNASSQLSASEIQLKNSEFEQFVGASVKGTEVQQLVRKVNTFNAQDIFPNDITITATAVADMTTYSTVPSGNYLATDYAASTIYSVSCQYQNGYVRNIVIN